MTASENRAVTAMFRVFGEPEPGPGGEASEPTTFRPMHEGERIALSILIPLTVFAAVWSFCRFPLGWLAALPLSLVALNVLPLALGGGTPTAHWRIWLPALALWSAFHVHAGGWTAWFAWLWIAILGIEVAAAAVLLGRRLWGGRGNSGITWRAGFLTVLHLAALALGFLVGWPWAIAAGALIAAWYCKAVLDPTCPWLGPLTVRTTGGPLITIDDGPDPRDTPVLLDLLDRHQRKAVFFLIGEKAAAHTELVREIVRRGHQIGNHTMTHPQASFWCAGPWRTRREIERCQSLLTEISGVAPRWFRAPVGHRNLFTHPVAADLGLEIMAWSRRGYDAVETDVPKILSRLTTGIRDSDILLLHESTPVAAEVLTGVLQSMITDH
ncbi:MAG: polysaccharide deacetylase family protein [Akkermansiaceae bacterium]|nr:polysaccharide deacetylase family protein [Akkermansiaceae bacterium]